jgi:hypothetical protein
VGKSTFLQAVTRMYQIISVSHEVETNAKWVFEVAPEDKLSTQFSLERYNQQGEQVDDVRTNYFEELLDKVR